MSKPKPEFRGFKRKDWVFLAVLGLFLYIFGILKLLTGRLIYRNYWNAPVFTPYVILGGILAIVGAFVLRRKKE
jgi:uncharacterized membrane protein HdeD (DUF308 family)